MYIYNAYTLPWQKLAIPGKCHIKHCFTSKIEKIILSFYENTLLFNTLWGNPPPNNQPYSSRKGVVKVVQIWHRDDQPRIIQSSNQTISRDRHASKYLYAHKIQNFFYHLKVRGLNGMAIEWWICPAAPTMWQFDVPCGPEHCHVETRMDDFCRQICFLQNQEGFLTMFSHNCPHSRFHREWSDCQQCGSK